MSMIVIVIRGDGIGDIADYDDDYYHTTVVLTITSHYYIIKKKCLEEHSRLNSPTLRQPWKSLSA